jgi:tRNA 2-thiocytidine biosynthesis protein TtcA
MSPQKTLLRRVGKAIHDYNMIREGDRIAVGVSGGKDSLALLEVLLLLQARSPVSFSVHAFTVEQGKFSKPIDALSEYMSSRAIPWTYYRDEPSFRLLEEQPEHGCDMCSRYRRRAVYDIALSLGANVVALGHTADDLCEALLRNTLFTGRLSALPAVTYSRAKDFRIIRPLVYVSEDLTTAYAEQQNLPLTPCVCSERSGTVRRSIREFLDRLKSEHPNVLESMLSAMSTIDAPRLLDRRFLGPDQGGSGASEQTELFPVLAQDTL